VTSLFLNHFLSIRLSTFVALLHLSSTSTNSTLAISLHIAHYCWIAVSISGAAAITLQRTPTSDSHPTTPTYDDKAAQIALQHTHRCSWRIVSACDTTSPVGCLELLECDQQPYCNIRLTRALLGLDDLCVRFILNLPQEELVSVERICFQVEEAQWFYEDFIRPLDATLPHLDLRSFSLRIFQHCPLFAQWSTQHYQSAFAEFMAYKQRVPVRGAIMLNDDMDEVVLVKGWKKSANWSFPRGKINKDEDDLDCAVREVYEETGLDLRTAGLVPERNQVKSIEMTMREQHMKLFVFRGIPRDTHFEARTRKEISKIEWYKLNDLPTFKKSKKHDAGGNEQHAINANKFYMVAPFLGHLKKWIAIQKKKDQRYSSHLAAPPLVADESEREALQEQSQANTGGLTSDLPETIVGKDDPTAQLKAMFNIPDVRPSQPESAQPAHMPQVDAEKSNALLSLLRAGPAAELRGSPQTPMEQVSFRPQAPQSPQRSHVVQHPQAIASPPPPFAFQTELPTSPPAHQSSALPVPQDRPLSASFPFQLDPTGKGSGATAPLQPVRGHGPDMVRQPDAGFGAHAPPASDMPKLTSHTKSLLDVFKGMSGPPPQSPPPGATHQPSHAQSLLDVLRQSGPSSSKLWTDVRQPAATHQNDLLELFGANKAAAELATTPAEHQPEDPNKSRLLALLQQDVSGSTKKTALPREGETSATMSGPLDQPNFQAVRQQKVANGTGDMGRSPLASHRKLYDPNEPMPVKILPRPQTPKGGRSPEPSKAMKHNPSPKRTPKASKKAKDKEQEKPSFQPQILRRPAPSEKTAEDGPVPVRTESPVAISQADSREHDVAPSERRVSQPDTHKQSLLSLFGGNMPPPARKASQQSSRVVSPLSTSQILSPKDEVPVSAVEPISTRSRMGSMVSVGSVATHQRPPMEKRTTGAENKAFLMNYLGRMASQDG
jgi:mRNA-decapping enzyme subunit 2